MNYYVYRLDDPITNQYYFGCRSCKCAPVNDIDYMGSMKTWVPDRSRLVKTIIKTGFNSMSTALEYESILIEKDIDNPLNENYYIPNKGFHASGLRHSEENKKKMSDIAKGRIFSESHKKHLRESHIGYVMSDFQKEKIRQSNLGRKWSKESKQNMSLVAKNRPKVLLKCPHCDEESYNLIIHRWHFDNCKFKN